MDTKLKLHIYYLKVNLTVWRQNDNGKVNL